jgi:hypothetical protein
LAAISDRVGTGDLFKPLPPATKGDELDKVKGFKRLLRPKDEGAEVEVGNESEVLEEAAGE